MAYEKCFRQFCKILENLSAILDKGMAYADVKKFDMEILLQSRLSPDQFPLIRQIQIACDTAKLGASRLCGKEAPVHQDTEKSLPEIKLRIKNVISYLQSLSSKDFADAEIRRISLPRWEGQYLTGEEFFYQHLIPNFYFHVTTAYSVLRHNGVDIGKKDYLGPMLLKK